VVTLFGAQEKKAVAIKNKVKANRDIRKIFAKVRAGSVGFLKNTNGKGVAGQTGFLLLEAACRKPAWAFEKVGSGSV
jgi:hypothetical protein